MNCLYGIVTVFSGNNPAAIFNVHEEKLRRSPNLAPEIVVGDELVTAGANKEVIHEHSDEKIGKEKCEENEEKCVEEAARLDNLGYAR